MYISMAEKTTILPTTVETTKYITTEHMTTATTNSIQTSTNENEDRTTQRGIATGSFLNSTAVSDMPTTHTLFEVSTEFTITEHMTTTEDPNKKTWSDWLRTCCNSSENLYYNGIETENNNFNLTSEMNVQHYDEIYINSRLGIGDWILFVGKFGIEFSDIFFIIQQRTSFQIALLKFIFETSLNDTRISMHIYYYGFFSKQYRPNVIYTFIAGTYRTNATLITLSADTDIYGCALLCKQCWYFGIRVRQNFDDLECLSSITHFFIDTNFICKLILIFQNNSCINITSMLYLDDANGDGDMTEVYSTSTYHFSIVFSVVIE